MRSRSIHFIIVGLTLLMASAYPTTVLGGDGYYLNPGFKFGHTFGQNAGFTIGIEVSYTKFTSDRTSGVLASLDYCRNADRFRYHVGVEYIAVAVGPTLVVENGVVDFGMNLTPYFGVIVIPFFNYTFRFAKSDLMEVGSFVKFPILVKGDPFRIGH